MDIGKNKPKNFSHVIIEFSIFHHQNQQHQELLTNQLYYQCAPRTTLLIYCQHSKAFWLCRAHETSSKTNTYPLYTSPNDPCPISSNEVNLVPVASTRPARSSIFNSNSSMPHTHLKHQTTMSLKWNSNIFNSPNTLQIQSIKIKIKNKLFHSKYTNFQNRTFTQHNKIKQKKKRTFRQIAQPHFTSNTIYEETKWNNQNPS